MKRITAVCLAFLIVFQIFAFQNLVFALTEKEVEYKFSQLDIFMKYKSGVTTTWSEARSKIMGAGGTNVKTEDVKDLDDWYVTKHGDKISELEFMRIIGDEGKAFQVELQQTLGWSVAWTSVIGMLGGLAYWYSNSGKNQKDANIGTNLAIGAAIVGLLNPWRPGNHFVSFSEAAFQIDLYNAKLKNKLGITD